MHTGLPVDRQAPEDRATKEHGASTKGQGLEDICPATDAAIDVHFTATSHRLDHFGQGLYAGDDTIELATTVIGNNNTSSSIFQS